MIAESLKTGVIIFLLLFFGFLIAGSIISAAHRDRRTRFRAFDSINEKATMRALETNSPQKARESLRVMEAAREEASDVIPDSLQWGYKDDLELVRERVADLEMEKWVTKADKYLQEFSDCWGQLVSADLETFRDVELFFATKNACLRAWHKYFSIDISEFDTAIYPKQYLREWMGEDYDPCMDSSEALEKRLSEYVQRMRPEQRRKNSLYRKLLLYVKDRETIAQADLLKVEFPGFVPAEIKCCYEELVRRNRLVKTKLGSRWFVSLSDQELSKREYQDTAPAAPGA